MPFVRKDLRAPVFKFVTANTMKHRRMAPRGTDDTGSTRIWIIIASVAGVLAIGACIALLAMSLSKRRLRKQLIWEAQHRDPFQSEELSRKRRKGRDISELEAESQRDAMIRKSLASRSGRSMSLNSQLTVDMMSIDDRPDTRSCRGYRLRDDEDFERSFTRSRSGTGLSDKSWEGGFSTVSSSSLPEMPARTLSRSPPPGRLSHVPSGRSDLPPLLEQHPLFRNVSNDLDSELERA